MVSIDSNDAQNVNGAVLLGIYTIGYWPHVLYSLTSNALHVVQYEYVRIQTSVLPASVYISTWQWRTAARKAHIR